MTDDTDERLDDLEAQLQEFKSAAQAAFQKAQAAEQEATECKDRLEAMETDLAAAERENEQLRAELAEVRERTDLLQAVKQASALESEEKAAVCIQNLFNKARNNDGKAALPPVEGLSALGNSVDRTTIYDVYRRAERLVGDDDLLWYQSEARGSDKNSRLILDLNAGTLPSTVAGYDIDGTGTCGSSTTRTTDTGPSRTQSVGD